MKYTVHQLAELAGVSVRTLHYYDEIGLLTPTVNPSNGYREYGEQELTRLQQILFFRELEFSLDDIKRMLDAPNFDAVQALREQQQLLELKKKRLETLLSTIQQTLKGGGSMSNDDKFSAFNDPTYQKYKDEVRERWGQTDAYKQSMQRVGKMTKKQLEEVKAEQEEITQKTAELMQAGFASDSPEVQEQIDRFYRHLQHFYDPSYEMFKGLGEMYVADSRFTAFYENVGKGLAIFMRDAMAVYADAKMANG